MITHHMRLTRQSALFGDHAYNIAFDLNAKTWIGGLANGQGECFEAASLADLLSKLGQAIVDEEGWK